MKFGFTIHTLFAWTFASLFIVLAVTDIKEKVVFDAHTYSLIVAGLIYAITVTAIYLYGNYSLMGEFGITTKFLINNQLTVSLLGAILGFVVMELASRSGYLLAGTRAFGEGDPCWYIGYECYYPITSYYSNVCQVRICKEKL